MAVKKIKTAGGLTVSPAISRIRVVDELPDGTKRTRTAYKKRVTKPKVSRTGKYAEEQARLTVESLQAFAGEYLTRHSRSCKKRTDGWWYDLEDNLRRASKKAQQVLEDDDIDDDDDLYDDEDEDEDEDDYDDDDE